MATIAAQTRDFARRFFEVVEELGRESEWVSARDAFARTIAIHADHPYVAYLQGHRARKAGFAAAAERVRAAEFARIERRKAGTGRNAPVLYRTRRPDASIGLELPYQLSPSHPLRSADPSDTPRRSLAAPEPRSPWRRRLVIRRTIPELASSNALRSLYGWCSHLGQTGMAALTTLFKASTRRAR